MMLEPLSGPTFRVFSQETVHDAAIWHPPMPDYDVAMAKALQLVVMGHHWVIIRKLGGNYHQSDLIWEHSA